MFQLEHFVNSLLYAHIYTQFTVTPSPVWS